MNRIINIVLIVLISLPSITCPSRTDPKFEGSYSDLAETYRGLADNVAKELSEVERELDRLGTFEQSGSRSEAFLAQQAYYSKRSWLEQSSRELRGRRQCYLDIAQQFSDLVRYKNLIRSDLQGQPGLYQQILIADWQEFLANKPNLLPKMLSEVKGYFINAYQDLSRSLPASGDYTHDAIRYGRAINSQFAKNFANIDALRELESQWEKLLEAKSSIIGQGATSELLALLKKFARRKEQSFGSGQTIAR